MCMELVDNAINICHLIIPLNEKKNQPGIFLHYQKKKIKKNMLGEFRSDMLLICLHLWLTFPTTNILSAMDDQSGRSRHWG